MRIVLTAAIVSAALIGAAHAQQQMQMPSAQPDWSKVDEAFGRKAAAVGGDVHRYGFPRSDLSVTLDGVAIKPGLALGGWVAFKPAHGGVMAMGDLVLLESEINPQVASHGGKVSLVEVTDEGVVLLRFGGGCHGCGMVDATLRGGVERTLKERVPEVTGVADATDHSTGENPYMRRRA